MLSWWGMKLIFKIGPAKKDGRSEIALILNKDKLIAKDTDQILQTLDKLLKRNKIKIEDINPQEIKLRISKKAGLTSQRIVRTIMKAFSL